MIWVDPARYPAGLSHTSPKDLNKGKNWETKEENDDPLPCERPGEATLFNPRDDEKGTYESAHVQMHGVKGNDGHCLQGITVHDV